MNKSFSKVKKIRGELFLPGDKSISHRALIFSAMAEGQSVIENLSDGEDVQSTIDCLTSLGVEFDWQENKVVIQGVGFKGFKQPCKKLYAGNSGTTARLLCGLLSAQQIECEIVGDDSLIRRPMKRVIEPLRLMNADINSTGAGTLPIKIKPSKSLTNISYELKIPSAQIKSALILCGLHNVKESCIIENSVTRDHTERMLNLKVEMKQDRKYIYCSMKNYPEKTNYFIPGDISTASFFIVLALLSKNSELRIKNVSLNSTRLAFLEILKKMGADIQLSVKGIRCSEEYGDLLVKSSELKNIEIPQEIIASLIDEIPILSAACVFAEGVFEIKNAKELRVKESDRIKSLVHNFKMLSLEVKEYEDGFRVFGKIKPAGQVFESFSDHRIAMTFSIISSLLEDGGRVNDCECIKISNPKFFEQLKMISEI
jgi:3-phosphoshikimate 1-carboxyvinyltransferase